MKIHIFVNAKWRGDNPIVFELDPSDLDTEEKLEVYGRGWASSFPEDIVMMEAPEYYLLIIDNDVFAEDISEKEHAFPVVSEEWIAAMAGVTWISRFPQDIAMVVEVPE